MDHFKPCELTESGVLVRSEGEVEAGFAARVTLLTPEKRATGCADGLLIVTTHRVVWVDRAKGRARSAELRLLPHAGPVEVLASLRTAKVLLRFGAGVRVEFGDGMRDRDRVVEYVVRGVRGREWERIEVQRVRETVRKREMGAFNAARAGVGGIVRAEEKRDDDRRRTIATGFSSLEELQRQAKDLITIADRFRNKTSSSEEENELLGMMAAMGIESPVTKASSGGNVKLYRELLAKQIADCLREPVLSIGGIMTLTDAYCLVMRNRATTELVAPADFKAAVELFRSLKLPLQLVRLESGVLAVKLDASKDPRGAQRLAKLAAEKASVSAIEVTQLRHVPIQRAVAMLEEAEALGLLARDETDEGTRFFPNHFPTLAGTVTTAR